MESTTLGGQSGGFSETTTPQYEGDLIQLVSGTARRLAGCVLRLAFFSTRLRASPHIAP